jgi:hypothetical protein
MLVEHAEGMDSFLGLGRGFRNSGGRNAHAKERRVEAVWMGVREVMK